MVEILLIKITKSKNIKGIVYALSEAEAEAFADITTLIMERSPENLRAAKKYIQDFHTISGLACNLDKTHVIPIGRLNDPKDIICPELGITWSDHFTILGFDIDNKPSQLNSNFTKIHVKIKGSARSWAPYKLSLRGRLTISKTMMCSQLTYVSTVLSPTTVQLNSIQEFTLCLNNIWVGLKCPKKPITPPFI
jgi:hypothetical protein